jgi:Bifunctional DNA primase/polymerase, N-terminal
MTADQPLRDAALAYAQRGIRVLPLHHPIQVRSRKQPGGVGCSCGDPGCGPVGKHPRTRNGHHDATADPSRLARWWQRWPQANIGLVTGELADVLDVDGPAGQGALRRWATQHQLCLEGPLVRTGSGWHHYLAATGIGNRAGLLEHVDWRGRGGYVVAPPSLHANGTRYRWLRPLTVDLPAALGQLRNLLGPVQQQRPEAVPRFCEEAAGHPYGRTALQEELAAVAQAPKGRRNHTLYQAGIRLYSLVAGGVLDHDEVQAGLLAAAQAGRLLAEEPLQTHRTLASAERTGLAHPRGIPTSNRAPRPTSARPSRAQLIRGRDDRERDA